MNLLDNFYAGAEIRTQEPTKGVGFPTILSIGIIQSALNDSTAVGRLATPAHILIYLMK